MRAFDTESGVVGYLQRHLIGKVGCYLQKTSLKFLHGFPDLVVGYRGRVAFYEVKRWRGASLLGALRQVDPVQWATIHRMREAGLPAFVLVVKDPSSAWLVYPWGYMSHYVVAEVKDFGSHWKEDPANLFAVAGGASWVRWPARSRERAGAPGPRGSQGSSSAPARPA